MLIATEQLSIILRATFLSAKVKREDVKPVSLFLVAPFERGKTSIVLQNAGPKSVVLTDATGYGLLEALSYEKDATHIIINDLTTVAGHRSQVSQLTISILNALAEEGSYKVAVPRLQHLDLKGRRIGVVACCVPSTFSDGRSWWVKSGFASRLLVLQFDHSAALTARILLSIATGNGKEKEVHRPLVLPEADVYVEIPKSESLQILALSKMVAAENEELGYRKEKQLRSLACGHALLRTWKKPKVGKEDMAFLEKAIPFIVGVEKKDKSGKAYRETVELE